MKKPLVSVALCTLNRPEKLEACLKSLGKQKTSVNLEIVVIENEAAGSSRGIVKACAKKTRFPIHYFVEPTRGIPWARNKAVAACKGEWIAFIDDDETADPFWIDRLLAATRDYSAEAVLGKVVRLFPENFPSWQVPLFLESSFSDGAVADGWSCCTANLLIRADLLKSIDGPFDTSYSMGVSEDTAIGVRLMKAGLIFRWAKRAKVTEIQGLERGRLIWYLRRSYRCCYGNTRIRYNDASKFQALALVIASIFGGTIKGFFGWLRFSDPRTAGTFFLGSLFGQAGKFWYLFNKILSREALTNRS